MVGVALHLPCWWAASGSKQLISSDIYPAYASKSMREIVPRSSLFSASTSSPTASVEKGRGSSGRAWDSGRAVAARRSGAAAGRAERSRKDRLRAIVMVWRRCARLGTNYV